MNRQAKQTNRKITLKNCISYTYILYKHLIMLFNSLFIHIVTHINRLQCQIFALPTQNILHHNRYARIQEEGFYDKQLKQLMED